MRGRLCILVVSTLLTVALAFCACTPGEPPATSDYTPVTIGELIGNTTKYDGQKVEVSGTYTVIILGRPACIPVETNKSIEIREDYEIFSSGWGISDDNGIISVVVISDSGVQIGSLPNYGEDEEIELRGVARAATVKNYCWPYIRYKSVYIEVNASDIDVDLKPLPSQ